VLVTICESLDQVRHDVQAAHGAWVVSLDARDGGARHLGHARAAALAGGAARLGGVAVVLDGAWAPDPVQLLIVDGSKAWSGNVARASLVIPRSQLPVQVQVDILAPSVRLLREGFGAWKRWVEPVPEELPGAYDDAEPYGPGAEE
jgi:hypothetical protein